MDCDPSQQNVRRSTIGAQRISRDALRHSDALDEDQAVTPKSLSLARARRSSSVPGYFSTTRRNSRMPAVFWPRETNASPFFKCAWTSFPLLGYLSMTLLY